MTTNQNKGMLPVYDGLQDADLKEKAEMVETINQILSHEDKTRLINRKNTIHKCDNKSCYTIK